jgi:hypothetical protein
VTKEPLAESPALWNRSRLALESDEVLAQLLDRGTMADWRRLYAMAAQEPRLRARLHRIITTVPVPLPRFWLAALSALGEDVDLTTAVPDYYERTTV